jgi:quercetin dioxygenase-like cupin family protein
MTPRRQVALCWTVTLVLACAVAWLTTARPDAQDVALGLDPVTTGTVAGNYPGGRLLPGERDEPVVPLFENEKVKVYEVRYAPGERTPTGARPARIVRAVTGGAVVWSYPDGSSERVDWSPGDTKWMPRQALAGVNIGAEPMVFFVVEPK